MCLECIILLYINSTYKICIVIYTITTFFFSEYKTF